MLELLRRGFQPEHISLTDIDNGHAHLHASRPDSVIPSLRPTNRLNLFLFPLHSETTGSTLRIGIGVVGDSRFKVEQVKGLIDPRSETAACLASGIFGATTHRPCSIIFRAVTSAASASSPRTAPRASKLMLS